MSTRFYYCEICKNLIGNGNLAAEHWHAYPDHNTYTEFHNFVGKPTKVQKVRMNFVIQPLAETNTKYLQSELEEAQEYLTTFISENGYESFASEAIDRCCLPHVTTLQAIRSYLKGEVELKEYPANF